MYILCGDIGGTKTRLAIFDLDDFPRSTAEDTYPSNSYDSLEEIILEFLSGQNEPIAYAAFGIAGPILGRSCRTTNLPWLIDANQIEQKLEIPSAHLINDLEATAYGIAALNEGECYTLQAGSNDAQGNCAVIAAGTGLGQAGMFWNGTKHIPFSTEGGHSDFAPGSELEFELLSTLKQSESNVCWEDILSGPGLVSIYRFLLEKQRLPNQPRIFTAEAIANAANDGDPLGIDTMKIYSRLYGAEAGNLALKIMATGGVYIGGGIAPKILDWLKQPQFLEAFLNKGKMRTLMESIPVHVILNDRAALYGPALYLRENVLQS